MDSAGERPITSLTCHPDPKEVPVMTRSFSSAATSRRGFLTGTLLAAGAGLAGCTTGKAPASGGGGKSNKIVVMYQQNEFTKAHVAEFEKLNPGTTIEFIEFDQTRLNAMLAAGSPPDFVRGAADVNNILRGLVHPLDEYLNGSSVIKKDDLLPISNGTRWDGKKLGAGPYYGMIKDWSLDGSLWHNTALFEKAGVPPLSSTEPASWDDLMALGKKLTVRKNGKIVQHGLGMEWAWGLSAVTMLMIAQQDGPIFNDALTEINLTSPAAVRALQWFADYGRANVGPTSLNPLPDGSDQATFSAGRMAISMDGYWFGANFADGKAPAAGTVRFAPGPTFGRKLNASFPGGIGAWIPAKAANKDGAWKVMEYFIAGPPAVERAKSGWGLPALQSLWQYLPQEKPYQKQAIEAAKAELANIWTIPRSPYLNGEQLTTTFDTQLTDVLKGKISVADAGGKMQDQLNKLLKQGKEQFG
jgi:multiple sugar transport system substrate-binding protein